MDFVKLLWLSFTFLPSLRAEDVTTIIDDSDPSIKALNGNWVHFTGDEYYNKTESLTRDAGATSMYIFNGTGISVFGTQCDPAGGNTTVSTYTVDNNGPSTYTVPSGVVCNQNFVNFFSSPPLENGKHTLIITNLNHNAWYFLDYLQVVSPGSPSASNNATASAPSPSSATSSTSSSTSQTSSTNGSTSTSRNTGVIVGSAFGAAVFVGIVILVFLVYWRRRRQSLHKAPSLLGSESNSEELSRNGYPTPFRTSAFLQPSSHSGVTRTTQDKHSATNATTTTSGRASSSHSPPRIPTTATAQTVTSVTSPSMVSVNRRPTTSTMPPPYG